MAAIVLGAVNSVRGNARAAAIKAEARQLFTLAQMHYFETGNYRTFVSLPTGSNAHRWLTGDSHSGNGAITCSEAFSDINTYTQQALQICQSMTSKLPTNEGDSANNKMVVGCSGGAENCTDSRNNFSVQVKLQDSNSRAGDWFCIGSSGAVSEMGNFSASGAGCIYKP